MSPRDGTPGPGRPKTSLTKAVDFDTLPEGTTLWERLPNEPSTWYFRFALYFLPHGTGRSLHGAYRRFLLAEKPGHLEEKKGVVVVDDNWKRASRLWRWQDRADIYYQELAAISLNQMQEAQLRLQELTPRAVEALAEELSGRFPVQAAKAILDRAGLSAVQNIRLSGAIGLVGIAGVENLEDDELAVFLREMAHAALESGDDGDLESDD